MKSYRTTLAILILVILILCGVWFFLYQNVQKLSAQVSELGARLAERENTQEKHLALKRLLDDTQGQRLRLKAYFANDESLVAFIEELEALGRKIGVSIEVDNATTAENKLSINLELAGSFGSVYRYIQLLEVIPYAVEIERVAMQEGRSEGTSTWNAEVALTLPILKP